MSFSIYLRSFSEARGSNLVAGLSRLELRPHPGALGASRTEQRPLRYLP